MANLNRVPSTCDDNNSDEMWKARITAMERFFGPADQSVLHGPVPFSFGRDMGGSPDVLMFSKCTEGKLYVTADLIGANHPPNSAGEYELAVVHEDDEQWGVAVIAQLAHFTAEIVLDDGETMDVGSATPEGSTIEAFLFRRIAEFDVLGNKANVICCIGITASELAHKQAQGARSLINILGHRYFTTDLYRASFV